ncbi:unnamed protein product [Fusarium fujikuroi]|uniref:Uncharacterized protein n=1 Tax=Fusarium fujikuroi TaxID=5127 RepID=A0A9Q9RFC0_FUSFU|nr:unnamed protein product [Fusarium fujikuroi]
MSANLRYDTPGGRKRASRSANVLVNMRTVPFEIQAHQSTYQKSGTRRVTPIARRLLAPMAAVLFGYAKNNIRKSESFDCIYITADRPRHGHTTSHLDGGGIGAEAFILL